MYGDKDGVIPLPYAILSPYTFRDYVISLSTELFETLCWVSYPLLLLGPHQNAGLQSINTFYVIISSKQISP